jgi:O-antigen/teichoic acid export membrane protein
MGNFKYIIFSNIISILVNLFILVLITKNYQLDVLRYFFLAQSLFLIIYSVSFSNIYYNLFTSFGRKEYKTIFTESFYGYLLTSIFLFIIINLFLIFFNINTQFKLIIIIINLNLLLEPLSLFYYHFYLKKLFKIIFFIKISSLTLGLGVKTFLIFNNYNIITLASAFVVEQFFFTLLILLFFKNSKYEIFTQTKKIKFNFIKFLKKNYQYPVIGLSVFLIFRVDIFFIDYFLDQEFVTIYSIISRPIIVGFGFMILINQYFLSKMNIINLKLKKFYIIYYQKLICINFFIYLFAFILVYLFSDFYFQLFVSYYKNYKYLMLYLCVMSFFASIVNVWFNHMIIQKKIFTVLYFHIISICLYVILNYYFILFWGLDGIVLSMIFSLIITFIIVNLFNPEEVYLITNSLSFKNLMSNAKIIINETLIKKKPEKNDT